VPTQAVVILIAAAILLSMAFAVVGAVATMKRDGWFDRFRRRRAPVEAPEPTRPDPITLPVGVTADAQGTGSPYARAFRVAAWTYLMVVLLIVSASGLWPAAYTQIVILIALAGGASLALHDLVPPERLGAAHGPLQAGAALVFASVLVVLTGGFASPFAFTFALAVGAAALVSGVRSTVFLGLGATVAYGLAATVSSGGPSVPQIVEFAVILSNVFLLAYIGSVVGREQRRERDAALRLSSIDSLTGLYTRTFFSAAVEQEISRSVRTGRGFGLIVADVDELKEINDRFGHPAGDSVLKGVAKAIEMSIRRIDLAARYGGDEFVALLPETDPTGAWVVAEKLRLNVAELKISGYGSGSTVSVGAATFPTDGSSADALLLAADRAMYQSKRGGKNSVTRPPADTVLASLDPDRGRGPGPGSV
jgi:diguanylate cyclase (GGDEF)-like protein